MIKVVAALIERDNKFLIAKRSTGDSNVFCKWEFPGGKVESNENEFQAIERKIKEVDLCQVFRHIFSRFCYLTVFKFIPIPLLVMGPRPYLIT